MTHQQLKSMIEYDLTTGVFKWLVKPSQAVKVGDVAGSTNDGYVRIKVGPKRYLAHVLAWFYVTGSWPEHEIDHKDGDGTNNRYDNLRPATHGQNAMNKRTWAGSGYKGVSWSKTAKKYRARIQVNKTMHELGDYKSAEEAARVYDAAARQHHGEFAKTNFDN